MDTVKHISYLAFCSRRTHFGSCYCYIRLRAFRSCRRASWVCSTHARLTSTNRTCGIITHFVSHCANKSCPTISIRQCFRRIAAMRIQCVASRVNVRWLFYTSVASSIRITYFTNTSARSLPITSGSIIECALRINVTFMLACILTKYWN